MPVQVHLEVLSAIGRVYYVESGVECDPYAERRAFNAVFFVTFLGEGKAKLMAAHGTVTREAYRRIAEKLFQEHQIHHCLVERAGKEEVWDVARAARQRSG